jgi:threonylcarbamoyladenosine tRNA methylthiotransferase MtaB
MARKTTKQSYREIVKNAREVNPNIAITTDMIVGFPGETDDDFNETLDFVQEIGFAGGHVFSFSSRPGTPAAKYDLQVPGPIRKRRSAVLRSIFLELAYTYQSKFIGKNLDVLWESSTKLDQEEFLLEGLSGNYIKVSAIVSTDRWNIIENVHIENFYQDSLIGVINE